MHFFTEIFNGTIIKRRRVCNAAPCKTNFAHYSATRVKLRGSVNEDDDVSVGSAAE